MFTVTNKAASLLKVAKTAEGAPRDAGIRLRLDSGLQALEGGGSGQPAQLPVSGQTAHHHAVLLLDPGLIVLVASARTVHSIHWRSQ
jgi:hypothetical protein